MQPSTCYLDAVAKPGTAEIGVLFPAQREEFLFFPASSQPPPLKLNKFPQVQLSGQERVSYEDALVRLPSLRVSKWKVIVLQRWVGRVEFVQNETFCAILLDSMNSHNPPEEVELDLREVSESDLPLLAEGATFYWSIGYRDTPGGQRERISTLRFARQPRLTKLDQKQIFEEADCSAAFLERD